MLNAGPRVQRTKRRRSFEVYYRSDCSQFADPLLPDSRSGKKSQKHEAVNHDSLARIEFCLSAVRQRPHNTRPRVTVYWHGEGSGRSAAWNGARLREDNCAVDPKKIPYGSKVIFGDSECTAIDTGPGVVKRKAARSLGRTIAERNAIIVERFFDTRQRALAWENAHPHFMMVRVQTRD